MKRSRVQSQIFDTPWFRWPLTWLITGVVIMAVGLVWQFHWLDGLENQTRDLRIVTRGTQPILEHIVIIEIDDQSLAIKKPEEHKTALDLDLEKPIDLWGDNHARVLRTLRQLGAKTIGMDFLVGTDLGQFLDPNHKDPNYHDPNQAMAQEVADNPHIVLNFRRNQLSTGGSKDSLPIPRLLFALELREGKMGFSNMSPDPDGVVRRFTLRDSVPGSDLKDSFALSLAGVDRDDTPKVEGNLLTIGDRSLALSDATSGFIDFLGPDGTFPRISYRRLLQNPQKYRDVIRGSICLIGITSEEFQDTHYVPFSDLGATTKSGLMAGVEVQANILHTLLAGRSIKAMRTRGVWGLIVLAALWAIPTSWLPRISLTIPISLGTLGIWIWLCWIAFDQINSFWPFLPVAAAFFLNQTFLTTGRLWQESQRKRWVEDAMGRYVSPEVLQHLTNTPDALKIGGARQDVTILFSDIRGFTNLSEEMPPEQVTRFLNNYLAKMVEIVYSNAGTVDKFMGDGIMVVFNWPLPQGDHATRALRCAIEMQQAVSSSAPEWTAMGIPKIEIGIGLHSGPAILGNFGSARKMERTAIGDTVNVASRIEGLCKTLGKSLGSGILMSETTCSEAKVMLLQENLQFETVAAGETAVRGRREALQLFAVQLFSKNAENAVSAKTATADNKSVSEES